MVCMMVCLLGKWANLEIQEKKLTEGIVAIENHLGRVGGLGGHLDDEGVTAAAAAAMERPLETHGESCGLKRQC